MIKFNRTKVIATVGPAIESKNVLTKMGLAGVDVFRINFSHGTYDEILKTLQYVREINVEYNTNVGLLADLQGPKIRIGEIRDGKVKIRKGDVITITTKKMLGNTKRISINYENFPKDIKEGDRILIDDGKLEMQVVTTNRKDTVKVRVIYDGNLSSNKGVNLPNTKISLPSLTEKDLKDLNFTLNNNFDWVALSFVRSASDITHLKHIIRSRRKKINVIAKIEKPEATKDISNIIRRSDAIMVARGDLGVEIPMEEVPVLQKKIVEKCRAASKPVIIATQVMENMIYRPNPLRAEVTDVANAVYEGADAIMLSGETSIGKYPVKVIETIEKILERVEREDSIYLNPEDSKTRHFMSNPNSKTFISDAICYNVCKISQEVNAKAIIGMTRSGYTAYQVSSYRPKAKVIIFTNNFILLNSLSLLWGAKAFYYDKFSSTDETIYDVKRILRDSGIVKKGDVVINTASIPIHDRQRTNMIKVSVIE